MVKLYYMDLSHPSQAARAMLELKGVSYERVNVLPLNQRLHLRVAGFRGGTVPAMKVDGRRIQGSRDIARALDELFPDPPLFPADPELRAKVEEAERWGDEQLQPVPRRIARFGAARNAWLREMIAERQSMPMPSLSARVSGPITGYYANTLEADGRRGDEQGVRADLAALPGLLDHADELLADGTLSTDPPNAATFQILATIRLLDAIEDLRGYLEGRPSLEAARALFPRYDPGLLPAFLPREWLESDGVRSSA